MQSRVTRRRIGGAGGTGQARGGGVSGGVASVGSGMARSIATRSGGKSCQAEGRAGAVRLGSADKTIASPLEHAENIAPSSPLEGDAAPAALAAIGQTCFPFTMAQCSWEAHRHTPATGVAADPSAGTLDAMSIATRIASAASRRSIRIILRTSRHPAQAVTPQELHSSERLRLLYLAVVTLTAEERWALLSRVTSELGSGEEAAANLRTLARLLVPALADWCTITLIEENGVHRRLVAYHHDPAKAALTERYEQSFPPGRHRDTEHGRLLTDGRPLFFPRVGPDFIAQVAQDDEHRRLLEALGVHSCLLVPIRGASLVGVLSLMTSSPARTMGDADRSFVEAVARQAGLAIENARLLASERCARTRTEGLLARERVMNSLAQKLSAALSVDAIAQIVVGGAVEVFSAISGGMWELPPDANELRLAAAIGYPESARRSYARLTLSLPSPIVDAVREKTPIWVRTREDYERRWPASFAKSADFRPGKNLSFACFPLAVENRVTGALSIVFEGESEFDADLRRFLEALASSAAIALDRISLFERERQARAYAEAAHRRESFLVEAGRNLAESFDPEETLAALARTIVPDFADWCFVDLFRDGSEFERIAATGARPEDEPIAARLRRRFPARLEVGVGVAAAAATRAPQLVTEVTDDMLQRIARDADHLEALRLLGARSFVSAPLVARGNVSGVLTLASRSTYAEQDMTFATKLANRAALSLENARLVNEARAASNAAREADRRKDEFLAMLGHELRNPLAPMVTALEMMKLRGGTTLARERGVLERQVQHMSRLVDDLLDVSRITRGKIELRRKRVDLGSIVRRALELADPLLDSRSHIVEVDLPEPIALDGDEMRLVQVLTNLLTNAAKYSETHTRIMVSAHAEGEQAVIRVRDEGVGISPELLPDIFKLFTQEARSIDRSQGGLGLGLTIVRSIIELHGGSVEAHSEGLGKGSEFVVRLPCLPIALETPVPPRTPRPSRSKSVRLTQRLLVVDDNREAADVLVSALRELGAEAEAAYDGPTALSIAAGFRPSVALLDLGLPVMDGFELARRLRARSRRIRLIAVTGYGQESDRRRALESGFDEHFVKPVEFDRLVDALVSTAPPIPRSRARRRP